MDPELRHQRVITALEGYDHGADAGRRAEAEAFERAGSARRVILVEGISDQIAVEALATRQGRDLEAEGVVVLPMGGAQAVRRYITLLGPHGANLELAGLCDAAEESFFRQALTSGGVGVVDDRRDMERLGFFVCVQDLEDELIRATTDIEAVLASQGDLGSFRTLQKQSAWIGRDFRDQIHRWFRAGATRNLRYARLLSELVSPEAAPKPLQSVLDWTRSG